MNPTDVQKTLLLLNNIQSRLVNGEKYDAVEREVMLYQKLSKEQKQFFEELKTTYSSQGLTGFLDLKKTLLMNGGKRRPKRRKTHRTKKRRSSNKKKRTKRKKSKTRRKRR